MTLFRRWALFAGLSLLPLLAAPVGPLRAEDPKPTKEDKLLKLLEEDFQAALSQEKHPLPIQQAAKLLAETNQNSRWTNYSRAVAVLRKHRSRAAVPLLLKYIVEHARLSTCHVTLTEYADTLVILTGADIPNPYRAGPDTAKIARQAVEKLVKDWWTPNKAKLSVDPADMTAEQCDHIVNRLLKKAERYARWSGRGGEPSASDVAYALQSMMDSTREERRGWWEEEAHPALLPALLATAGFQKDKTKSALSPRGVYQLLPATVPLLAVLRKNGEASRLDELAADNTKDSATRLACALALAAAGERPPAKVVLAILEPEKKLDRRVLAVLALPHCKDTESAAPALARLLDDPNEHVQTAAAYSLQQVPSKQALPKLKKMLDDGQPAAAMMWMIRAVAKSPEPEAREIMAGFLEETLKDPKKGNHIYHALRGFEEMTGQRWAEAGAHDPPYWRAKAEAAVKWWAKQKK